MFKLFGRQFNDWEALMSTVRFFRFNPHSIPAVSKVMCKLGRHDFMPVSAKEVSNKRKQVLLECFYCETTKSCTFDDRN